MNIPSDINIEFAHIELDDEIIFNKYEVKESALIAQRLLTEFTRQGLICSMSILIDDKRVDHVLTPEDVQPFLHYVSQYVSKIDYICFETQLSRYKDQIYSSILPENKIYVKGEIERYERQNKRLACSQDIAIWHLMRLGYIKYIDIGTVFPIGVISNKGEGFPSFIAKKVISVLAMYNKPYEEKADNDILKYCLNSSVLNQIKREYFNPESNTLSY